MLLSSRFDIELGQRTSWGAYINSKLEIDAREHSNWSEMTDWLHEGIHKHMTIFADSVSGPENQSLTT